MTRLTAAERAANVHPPVGRYKHLSLAEILELEVGPRWLLWALRKSEELTRNHRAFGRELWTFARAYAPEVYAQAMSESKAKAS